MKNTMDTIELSKETAVVALAAMKSEHKLTKRMMSEMRPTHVVAVGYQKTIDRLEPAIAELSPKLG